MATDKRIFFYLYHVLPSHTHVHTRSRKYDYKHVYKHTLGFTHTHVHTLIKQVSKNIVVFLTSSSHPIRAVWASVSKSHTCSSNRYICTLYTSPLTYNVVWLRATPQLSKLLVVLFSTVRSTYPFASIFYTRSIT